MLDRDFTAIDIHDNTKEEPPCFYNDSDYDDDNSDDDEDNYQNEIGITRNSKDHEKVALMHNAQRHGTTTNHATSNGETLYTHYIILAFYNEDDASSGDKQNLNNLVATFTSRVKANEERAEYTHAELIIRIGMNYYTYTSRYGVRLCKGLKELKRKGYDRFYLIRLTKHEFDTITGFCELQCSHRSNTLPDSFYNDILFNAKVYKTNTQICSSSLFVAAPCLTQRYVFEDDTNVDDEALCIPWFLYSTCLKFPTLKTSYSNWWRHRLYGKYDKNWDNPYNSKGKPFNYKAFLLNFLCNWSPRFAFENRYKASLPCSNITSCLLSPFVLMADAVCQCLDTTVPCFNINRKGLEWFCSEFISTALLLAGVLPVVDKNGNPVLPYKTSVERLYELIRELPNERVKLHYNERTLNELLSEHR